MTKNLKTKILVLKRKPFVKNSKLLSALSEEKGLLKIIAKGSLLPTSRISGLIEPFSLLSAELVLGRDFYYLTHASLVKNFLSEEFSLEKFQFFSKIAEFALKMLPEEEKNIQAFKLTIKALELAENSCLPVILVWYKLNLLSVLGLLPRLPKNIQQEKYFFSAKEGGFVETGLPGALIFDLPTVSLFLNLLSRQPEEFLRERQEISSLQLIESAIDQFLCYHS